MKIKQTTIENKGIIYNVCPLCKTEIHYPDGIYFRNGIEVHSKCIVIARLRRGKIEGIDN